MLQCTMLSLYFRLGRYHSDRECLLKDVTDHSAVVDWRRFQLSAGRKEDTPHYHVEFCICTVDGSRRNPIEASLSLYSFSG